MQIKTTQNADKDDFVFRFATIQQDRLLPGIHGLRGIAALAVVLFHLVHLANITVPIPFSFIAADFGKGVHLFFVLSAFSLMYSTQDTMHRSTWASEYFVKRFFRIAPLYYFILLCMVLWPLIKWGTIAVSFDALLLNITFMFGLAPWSGIVWAGWTVGVEMLFYAILPVLLLTVRTTSATIVVVVASVIITYAARSTLHTHYEMSVKQYGYNWANFSFAANLCFFAMGMYAFRLARQVSKTSALMRWYIPALSIVLLGALMLADRGHPLMAWKGDPFLWGVGLAALCFWQSVCPSRWCANRFFEYVGERSYSVYLLHPIVIVLLKTPIRDLYDFLAPQIGSYAYFLCAPMVLLPLLLLSEVAYRMIEIPGIRFGQNLNSRIRARAVSATPPSQENSTAMTKYSV